jgi:hypothetical protein
MDTKRLVCLGAMMLVNSTILLPINVSAQVSEFAQLEISLLKKAKANLSSYGSPGQPMMGSMYEGDRQSQIVQLTAGVDYAFMAVCNSDCTNVHLRLLDEQGHLVSSNLSGDDSLVTFYTPSNTAEYQIEVEMSSCSTEPCSYLLGKFSR